MRNLLVFCWIMILAFSNAYAEEIGEVKKIQDNSFLIEEAYNQEPGVIQHIQAFQYMKNGTWGYSFVQEWPVPGRTHQLSYTIPVFHLDTDTNGKKTGIGDVMLNYRYQLIYKEKEGIALAPRLSLIFPTGDYKDGFGRGGVGLQTNIPFSVDLSDKWVTHWNLGATFTPKAKEAGGAKADTLDFNSGASVIYHASENFNLMLEAFWSSIQSVEPDGTKKNSDAFFINPGARFALNFKSGLQIVPGIAFPIGLGPSRGEYGVFLYLSFEHPLFRPR
jgi:hypothetical protein